MSNNNFPKHINDAYDKLADFGNPEALLTFCNWALEAIWEDDLFLQNNKHQSPFAFLSTMVSAVVTPWYRAEYKVGSNSNDRSDVGTIKEGIQSLYNAVHGIGFFKDVNNTVSALFRFISNNEIGKDSFSEIYCGINIFFGIAEIFLQHDIDKKA